MKHLFGGLIILIIVLFSTCEQIPPMGGHVDRSKSNRYSYGIFKNSIYYKSGSPTTDTTIPMEKKYTIAKMMYTMIFMK